MNHPKGVASTPIVLMIVSILGFVAMAYIVYQKRALDNDFGITSSFFVHHDKTVNRAAWKTFTNKAFGWSVQYPATWKTPTLSPDGIDYTVTFDAKQVITSSHSDTTASEWLLTEQKTLGSTLTKSSNITVGGQPAVRVDTSTNTTYIAVRKGSAFLVITTADAEMVTNGMLDTFTFVDSTASTDVVDAKNTSLHTYTSPNLGVSFQYLYTAESATKVYEKDDTIYVYEDGTKAIDGQFVRLFHKDASTTLKTAITQQFLQGYNTKDCYAIDVQKKLDVQANFILAGIGFPEADTSNGDPWFANADKCPAHYTASNWIGYFATDPAFSTKFVFFSIGQYGIPGTDSAGGWQNTLKFL